MAIKQKNNEGLMPVEKLFLHGPSSLSEVELISILIGYGSKQRRVLELAALLYNTMGGLDGMKRLNFPELLEVNGIGKMKASKLAAAVELGKRVVSFKKDLPFQVKSPRDIYELYSPLLASEEREIFIVIGLDIRGRIIFERKVAQGTLFECPISPREIFSSLLKYCAASGILIHNHPSGDPSPSNEDKLLTIRMCEAGRLIGIKILDHIIIAEGGWHSFKQEGVIS